MPTSPPTKPTCGEPSGPGWSARTAAALPKANYAPSARAPWRYVLLALLALAAVTASAASWTSRLADGKRIEVDPNTNRVTVFAEKGGPRQLWDGVHRLQDGSTITIRSGVMVPNRAVVELRQRLPSPQVAEADAPCQQLVRKVCGLHDECANHPACGPSRQLLEMSQNPAQAGMDEFDPTAIPWGVEQCRQALADETFFTPCDRLQRGKRATPCEQLFDKVCGPHRECTGQGQCPLAKQMLDMEASERRRATDPDAPTFTSNQCREGLGDEEFFSPCQP